MILDLKTSKFFPDLGLFLIDVGFLSIAVKMNSLWRFLIAFLAITGAVSLAAALFQVEFGSSDYWKHHGIWFLVFITLFPRLTLILSNVATGGVLWWLSWIFAPRILVAILATVTYWYQNPILVVTSWLVALSGESSEKYIVAQRSKSHWRSEDSQYDSARWVNSDIKDRK
jgi:hypothetical protein